MGGNGMFTGTEIKNALPGLRSAVYNCIDGAQKRTRQASVYADFRLFDGMMTDSGGFSLSADGLFLMLFEPLIDGFLPPQKP